MALVVPAGSTATIKVLTAGSPGSSTDLANLKSVGGSTVTRSMADVTALADTTLQRIPSRNDRGTLQLTFFLTDTATATNQITDLKAKMTSGTHCRINVSLPGSTIDDMFQYDGYITEVGEPEIGASDDALTYTVTWQRSDKY